MTNKYNHPKCITCWQTSNPDRTPVTLNFALRTEAVCCTCGGKTSDGIYVRNMEQGKFCFNHAEEG